MGTGSNSAQAANVLVDSLRIGPTDVASRHPGWGQTPEYTGWRDEQLAWKTTCSLGDWSFLWDVVIEGPDALKLFSDSGINSVAKFDVGQAKHLVQCNDEGKVITDGVLLRLGEARFSTQSTPAFYSAFLAESGDYDVTWHEQKTFQYQVGGPKALEVMERVTGRVLTDIKFMRFEPVTIAGHEVLAVRQGMSGEIGFELHGDAEFADAVYEAVLAVGSDFGMRKLGSRTALINHLEACFPTGGWHYLADMYTTPGYGKFVVDNFDLLGVKRGIAGSFESEDISDYMRSPVEMGWGRSIKFDHEFRGRAALEQEVASPRRQIVTFEFDPDDVARVHASLFQEGDAYDPMEMPLPQRYIMWADKVVLDGNTVGVSTVPGYSYFFRKFLSLAYVDVANATPGTKLKVLWGSPGSPQTELGVTVAAAPYKTDRRRTGLAAAN